MSYVTIIASVTEQKKVLETADLILEFWQENQFSKWEKHAKPDYIKKRFCGYKKIYSRPNYYPYFFSLWAYEGEYSINNKGTLDSLIDLNSLFRLGYEVSLSPKLARLYARILDNDVLAISDHSNEGW